MKRFFGMMPTSEIEIERVLTDSCGLNLIIQAGPNGWSILWADGGSTYKDEVHTSEENYNTALEEVKNHIDIVSVTDSIINYKKVNSDKIKSESL